MKTIALLCYQNFQILDLTGPMEVFHQLNTLDKPTYRIKVISEPGGLVTASNGLQVATQKWSSLRDCHTLVVIGGVGIEHAVSNKNFLRFIQRHTSRVERMVSVCSGSLALAAAGSLSGKSATSHWRYIARLSELDTSIRIEPDAIYIEDGKVFTSAGVTAGMDLALALVERDSSRQAAMKIARNLVMAYRRDGGQSQYSEKLRAQQCDDDVLSDVCLYIQDNLQRDLRVEVLARRCAMSSRNFSRKFTRIMKCSPGQYVEQRRIERAKDLLNNKSIALKALVEQCGYQNLDVFRRAFYRNVGVSAAAYQKRFGPGATLQQDLGVER
ncbi:DJ-1/PfpI family protein [Gilvimarinus sp. SDUM040013]|uniref:DJ-1/PfpI family protein n=1 Tax=Gilvimarinus gilvus TaxID=3058038 RepID=A0ABU4RZ87_9GAMM|nr:DJ-1/PfpI family protein [Gilvimarinus sp. SDUM040013]MDO3384639.1 DJ-1/PfpI family protein [Gilvimarinus sp. SDUM040013]MDX6850225.1 DJ-1/PfpI family protein [Gilvimarinus sp. SDUM040013]